MTRLSVIIPALNERDALPGLIDEISDAVKDLGYEWDILVVDDGSTDDTTAVVESLAADNPRINGVRLRRNFGKSEALAIGFALTDAELVVTIDGDGQDDPADIPRLIEALDVTDLVSGWKRDRQDPLSRRLASKWFNWTTARATGVRLHDMNCGLKAYRGECARSLEVYGEFHRFLPALAVQQGWRVSELPVNHRARQHGRSRFGLERYLRGALDLVTVMFIGRYQDRPLHFFGGLGLGLTVAGVVIGMYLTVLKILGHAIGERPLLFLGILLIVVGVQLLSLGLLGQMLVILRRDESGSRLDFAHITSTVGEVGSVLEQSSSGVRSREGGSGPGAREMTLSS